jgi:hypothetical protein
MEQHPSRAMMAGREQIRLLWLAEKSAPLKRGCRSADNKKGRGARPFLAFEAQDVIERYRSAAPLLRLR